MGQVIQFQRAKEHKRSQKIMLYGASGSGKTTLALQVQGPVVVLDMEGGTEYYGDKYEFDVAHITTFQEAMDAVAELRKANTYVTLVVDPITIAWASLMEEWQAKFLKHEKSSKGFKGEYYRLQPNDWTHVKGAYNSFLRRLIALNLNVIVTCHEKPKYSDSGFMQVVGETYDAEKNTEYMFDTVLRLFIEKGVHYATCTKDRTGRLPMNKPFWVDPAVIFSGDPVPQPEPVDMVTDEQLLAIADLADVLNVSTDKLCNTFRKYGGVENATQLTKEAAQTIIDKMSAAKEENGGE